MKWLAAIQKTGDMENRTTQERFMKVCKDRQILKEQVDMLRDSNNRLLNLCGFLTVVIIVSTLLFSLSFAL